MKSDNDLPRIVDINDGGDAFSICSSSSVHICRCVCVYACMYAHGAYTRSNAGRVARVNPRGQRRAGSYATRRVVFRFVACDEPSQSWNHHLRHRQCCREQFFAPCSRSPRFLCRTTREQPHRTGIWLHPSRHHMPSQTPRLLGCLWIHFYHNTDVTFLII
jgi:hypothetical protein